MKFKVKFEDAFNYVMYVLCVVFATSTCYFSSENSMYEAYIQQLETAYDNLDKEYQDYIDSTYNAVYGKD